MTDRDIKAEQPKKRPEAAFTEVLASMFSTHLEDLRDLRLNVYQMNAKNLFDPTDVASVNAYNAPSTYNKA